MRARNLGVVEKIGFDAGDMVVNVAMSSMMLIIAFTTLTAGRS